MSRDKGQARKSKQKRPKSDSESDSDSGPEDRNEPAKKMSKSGEASGSSGKKDGDGYTYFEVERNRRLTVREFKNKVYIDIREFYEKDGNILPGKKGISLSTTQWIKVKDLIPDVDRAVQELC